jgi:hypothetical protein
MLFYLFFLNSFKALDEVADDFHTEQLRRKAIEKILQGGRSKMDKGSSSKDQKITMYFQKK